MKKFLIGAALGAAAYYYGKKMKENGQLDQMMDEVNDLVCKTKQKVKDVIDQGFNKAEDLADRAETEIDKGKSRLSEMDNQM
ncbi:MAG: hypothetical protein LUG18_10735 [Candidatus Azobacteroides sp.]|nr:hypothetical protein [Candidatus Azobacteroides sp.]